MSTIVFIDTRGEKLPKAAQEAVTYASKLAGGPVTAVTFGTGSNLETLGAQGASKVIVARNVTAVDGQQLTKLVTDVAAKEGATTIVCVQDGTGKTVAPRIAAKLKAGHVAGAIAMPEGNTFKRNVFSGKAQAFLEVTSPVKVVSLMPNSIPIAKGEGTATVEEYSGDLGAARITVKEVRKAGVGIPLPEAEIVVSAGRGMKGPEHWGPIEELAQLLGGATACSRPVADMHWRPHHEHVGQTGVAIRPNCYIAIGISGAIQHLAGVNQSKVIAVINKDPEAPFFKAADYGIVGDAFEILPKLIEAAKKLNAER
ncbi:MAG: electron transfer flavoprotein subunit alpha/FixB family protein [Flavobacteriales bacterium]|mgnify:CR=1 FL=1|nr:electron transfer flavoprotein subunit alpha/FixB family protein [Flavobacteriales bacterium]MBK6884717.1 electron transfer flavoprotein subunit alpha/FixB family protein [Flavobacteriales bacterium]MBK7102042.1 electron transfer flavoprotein subunit alpha/FixB family protein [Flavobacteriales bacterium]MBK7114393.1 electron transfer flavoprotein subunit alpha/FixB family protein [Flavobacteriales bacterium]MBK7620923.1 electron transfer flavoprotein subunit alpha/FixB family protein [Flavob